LIFLKRRLPQAGALAIRRQTRLRFGLRRTAPARGEL